MPTAFPVRATITPLGNKAGLAVVQLHAWSGWVPSLQATPDSYRRVGEAGDGSQDVGLMGAHVTCTGWRAEISLDAAIVTIAAIELLQNEVIRLLDDWGRTIPRLRVWAARAAPVKTKGGLVSGTSLCTHRVAVSLEVSRLPDA